MATTIKNVVELIDCLNKQLDEQNNLIKALQEEVAALKAQQPLPRAQKARDPQAGRRGKLFELAAYLRKKNAQQFEDNPETNRWCFWVQGSDEIRYGKTPAEARTGDCIPDVWLQAAMKAKAITL